MNVKLTKQETEIVLKAISAYIREEEREQYTANCHGYIPSIYDERIAQLRELKQNINNQIQ